VKNWDEHLQNLPQGRFISVGLASVFGLPLYCINPIIYLINIISSLFRLLISLLFDYHILMMSAYFAKLYCMFVAIAGNCFFHYR
jgi:hypothetical protein